MTTVQNILIILTAGLLFSCSSNDSQQNGMTSTSTDVKTLDTTVSFSGSWLSENYYNSIRAFQSPRKAQDSSEFIVIPDRTLKQTMMIYNFHEGSAVLKILKNKDSYEMWEVQNDSLIRRLYAVEIISPTKIKLENQVFEKISPLTNQDNHQILEEILFKGHYTNADGKDIEFKSNGQLIGLGNVHFYEPVIDYFDAGLQVDQIGLGNSKKDLDRYGFKFRKDTLELYKLNCLTFDRTENRCVDVTFGRLAFKLWRKNSYQ